MGPLRRVCDQPNRLIVSRSMATSFAVCSPRQPHLQVRRAGPDAEVQHRQRVDLGRAALEYSSRSAEPVTPL
jgi:hypothetical protein